MSERAPPDALWQFEGNSDQPFGAKTYAQFGEDLIILNIFTMFGLPAPGFIDIGAHHPVHISNTALLYTRGSRGVNIDANPNLMAAFAQARPEDVTLNIGIGPREGTLDFYMIDEHSGRNTFDMATAEAFVAAEPQHSIQKIQKIAVRTLDSVVAEYFGGEYPPLLSIDAEGLDFDILESAHFSAGGPLVVIVEMGEKSRAIHALMRERGYLQFTRTVANAIFVREGARTSWWCDAALEAGGRVYGGCNKTITLLAENLMYRAAE